MTEISYMREDARAAAASVSTKRVEKFAAISDVHAKFENDILRSADFGGCSFLLLAGDIANQPNDRSDLERVAAEIEKWCDVLPVVYVSGGHDFWIKGKVRLDEAVHAAPGRFHCLDDRNPSIELNGVKIGGFPFLGPYGTDTKHILEAEARYTDYGNRHGEALKGCDILLMHCPPAHIRIPSKRRMSSLYDALETLKPKIAVCGHKHGCAGKYSSPFCPVYNIAETLSFFDADFMLKEQISI